MGSLYRMKHFTLCFYVLKFLYYFNVFVTCEQLGKHEYEICPTEARVTNNLTNLYNLLLCGESINCTVIETIIRNNVAENVIIVHPHDWNGLFYVSQKFWKCNIKIVAVDVTKLHDEKLYLASLCKSKYPTFVLSIANLKLDFVWNNMKQYYCVNTKQVTMNHTLEFLLQSCPRIIYLQINTVDYCTNTKVQFYQITHIDRSSDVAHKTLKVVTNSLSRLPFIGISDDASENQTGNFTGIVFELLNKIAKELDFNFTLQEPDDKAWGIFANGTWNGMIGMLNRKEVDMAVAPLTITYDRSQVVDFCSPFYFETIGILIKIDKSKNGVNPWKFILLFTTTGWIIILLSGVVSSIYIYFVNAVTPVKDAKNAETFNNCIWFAYSVMVNQYAIICLKSWSTRTFVTCWRLCAFIVISIYISGLVAVLSANKVTLPFSDLMGLADALNYDKYKICIEANTAFHAAIMEDDTSTVNILRLWLKKNPKYVSENCQEIFLKENDVAYIGELTVLKWIQNEFCTDYNLILLDDHFYPGYFGFALQKNSPYNALISDSVTKTIESGMIDLWNKMYSTEKRFCQIIHPNDVQMAINQQLNMYDLLGSFYILIIGSFISLFLFLLEIMLNRLCSKWFNEVKMLNFNNFGTSIETINSIVK